MRITPSTISIPYTISITFASGPVSCRHRDCGRRPAGCGCGAAEGPDGAPRAHSAGPPPPNKALAAKHDNGRAPSPRMTDVSDTSGSASGTPVMPTPRRHVRKKRIARAGRVLLAEGDGRPLGVMQRQVWMRRSNAANAGADLGITSTDLVENGDPFDRGNSPDAAPTWPVKPRPGPCSSK